MAALVLTSGLLVVTRGHDVTPVAETSVPVPPASTTESEPAPTTSTSAKTPEPAPNLTGVAKDVTAAVTAASRGTSVGFVLYDRETGEQLAAINEDKAYYTASVVKLLIAIDEVHQDDSGTWELPDADTVDDLSNMLSGSNDGLASAFWGQNGGVSIVTRTAELIGLEHTTPPTDPGQWGMTKTSADDIVTVYQYLEDTIPDSVAQPLLTALANARNPADDGWNQYFGIPEGLPGTSWMIKQGWMILKSALVLNTTGIVDSRFVVVLLTQQPLISSAKGRAAVTAGIKVLDPVLAKMGA